MHKMCEEGSYSSFMVLLSSVVDSSDADDEGSGGILASRRGRIECANVIKLMYFIR